LTNAAKPDLRALLTKERPIFNAWLGLGVPISVEIAAEAGWQAVTIDQQHGIGGPLELAHCLTAAKAAGVPALVRVAACDSALIGRALDAGAQGVIVPMVDTAEHAAGVVEAVKYPPQGRRSFGPYRARLMVEGDYFEKANGWTIACGQIETERAVENIDAICATAGFDMICVGPNDLAISMSRGRHRNIRSQEVLDAIEHVRSKAAAHGIITAIFANDRDFAPQFIESGWQIVSIGSDTAWLAAAGRANLDAVRSRGR
jgi:4-hydroxy-2-oxoheptanedioate aldolase